MSKSGFFLSQQHIGRDSGFLSKVEMVRLSAVVLHQYRRKYDVENSRKMATERQKGGAVAKAAFVSTYAYSGTIIFAHLKFLSI